MSIDIRLNKLEMDSTYLPVNDQDVANKKYVDNSLGATLPPGTVAGYAGTSAPSGWLLCDGSAIGRTAFAPLFGVIGTTHGQGDGSTTFNVPDYRGRFLRGLDGAAGIDPDKASRTAMNPGGQTGNAVGSVQADAFKSHTHPQQNNTAAGGSEAEWLSTTGGSGQASSQIPTLATGGNETRPVNAYVNFIIKT